MKKKAVFLFSAALTAMLAGNVFAADLRLNPDVLNQAASQWEGAAEATGRQLFLSGNNMFTIGDILNCFHRYGADTYIMEDNTDTFVCNYALQVTLDLRVLDSVGLRGLCRKYAAQHRNDSGYNAAEDPDYIQQASAAVFDGDAVFLIARRGDGTDLRQYAATVASVNAASGASAAANTGSGASLQSPALQSPVQNTGTAGQTMAPQTTEQQNAAGQTAGVAQTASAQTTGAAQTAPAQTAGQSQGVTVSLQSPSGETAAAYAGTYSAAGQAADPSAGQAVNTGTQMTQYPTDQAPSTSAQSSAAQTAGAAQTASAQTTAAQTAAAQAAASQASGLTVSQSYQAAVQDYMTKYPDRTGFKGYCNHLTLYQLHANGVLDRANDKEALTYNSYGKNWFPFYRERNGEKTSKGYTICAVEGKDAVAALVSQYGMPLRNLVVSFPETEKNQYGHVVFINEISADGKVHFTDSFTDHYGSGSNLTAFKEGEERTVSVDTFRDHYSDMFGPCAGAVWFSER